MPKRGGYNGGRGSRGSRGGSFSNRGRGRGSERGRGGHGRSSGFKRKHHSDDNGDGFIPLSGRQIGEYYRQLQIEKNRTSRKGQSLPPEVKFNKASNSGSAKKNRSREQSDSDESDQGLDSDEIDESEEEFLMQEFEWAEEDQDPSRKNIAKPSIPSDPPADIVIPTGWGGALAYSTSNKTGSGLYDPTGNHTGLRNQNLENSEDSGMELEKDLLSNMGQPPDVASIPSITEQLAHLLDHRHKRPKARSDLSKDIRNKLSISDSDAGKSSLDHSNFTNNDDKEPTLMWVIDTEPDSTDFKGAVQNIGGTVQSTEQIKESTLKSTANIEMNNVQAYQKETNGMKKEKLELKIEENAPMWVMDTMGEALDMEQIQETYIDVPTPEAEAEFSGRRRKKARRSKRSGIKLKEKEKERIKAMTDSGAILLEEDESEVNDEDLALLDYLQNTLSDSDNEGGANPFLGLMEGRHLDLGHSNDIGGLDPDESDFDEYISEIDSQDDENFDFTPKHRERKRSQKLDNELSRAIDGALSSGWPSGAPQGYEFFADSLAEGLDGIPSSSMHRRLRRERKGEPHGGSIETLTEINRRIEDFVKDVSLPYLQLEPMKTALRRRVHLLSTQYGLESESIGAGRNRAAVLLRSKTTMLPTNPGKVQEILTQNDRVVKQKAIEFRRTMERSQRGGYHNRGGGQMLDRNQRGGYRNRGEAGSRRPQGDAVANGTVVGATAAPISTENIGHRLLSKMGWTPGDGLGASGSGITKPIEAVMKRSRRGLGHE
ncbi:hypothetical protein BGZ76_004182 [Entomortierella beljakovae]|nr:hypothetical protein BGZ76_004182 [Entomortierella beljakovae]